MRVDRAFELFVSVFAVMMLAGCGGLTAPSSVTSPSPAALTGNWNIAGSSTTFPSISMAIEVVGTSVTAQGTLVNECSGTTISLAQFYLGGQIAGDGSFQLSDLQSSTVTNSLQIGISGTAPVYGGTQQWSGTYSLISSSTFICSANQSSSFVAAAIPNFSGNFVGTLSTPTGISVQPRNVALTLSLLQGNPTMVQTAYFGSTYELPLSATLTVTGLSCFTHGSSNGPASNYTDGNGAFMTFIMDDGSQVFLSSSYLDLSNASSIQTSMSVSGGLCSFDLYGGSLIRQ